MQQAIVIPRPTYYPDRRNWAARFEAFLGYILPADCRRMISVLERQRANRQPQRLFVVDEHPEEGRRQLFLCRYLMFLTMTARQGQAFHIVGRTRGDVQYYLPRTALKRLPEPGRQAILGTARSPEYARGLDYSMALLLDADTYPRRGRYMSRVWRTVLPTVSGSPDSLLVVHGRFRPRTRVNFFSTEVRRSQAAETVIPSLDLSRKPDPPPDDGEDLPPDYVGILSCESILRRRRDLCPDLRPPLSSRIIKMLESLDLLTHPLS